MTLHWVLVPLLLLAACQINDLNIELAQSTAFTVTIMAVHVTSIPSPSSTPLPTLTTSAPPVPTDTIQPPATETPMLSPTPSSTRAPTSSPTASPTLIPAATPTEPPTLTRHIRIGLNGRNSATWEEQDYQLVQLANIETLKMMSLTELQVFARLRQENPNIEFIVRLFDERMNDQGHPDPEAFADRMIPLMSTLQPYVTKFELGNEPNHFRRIEGWGPEDADAQNFNQWFLTTYDLLKTAHPWAELGFPALGTPDSVHRDKAWLAFNTEAINRADWLGVHCYWQTWPNGSNTMLDENHGLCFKYYHALFPDKPIELTEFDNDNIYYDLAPISAEQMAVETVRYFQELYKYPYLRSASSFIMSSSDSQNWESFVWRTEDGRMKPVVEAVGNMPRPILER